MTVKSFETEDYLIFSATTNDGILLDQEQCSRLFSIPATVSSSSLKTEFNFKTLDKYI